MVFAMQPERVCKALTGLSSSKLRSLTKAFSEAYREYNAEQNIGQNPKKPGAPLKYLMRQRLIFTLAFLKTNTTPDACAAMFKTPRSSMYYLIRTGINVLKRALKNLGMLPLLDIETAVEALSVLGKRIKIDATERPIRRPSKYQEAYYSGKQKQHTVKNQIITSKGRRVEVLSETVCGSVHDYKLFKHQKLSKNLDGFEIDVDLGYQGIEDYCPKSKINMPHKKPKNGELTAEQKLENKKKSSERVPVEHSIGGLKTFQAVAAKSRIILDFLRDDVMRTAAGLWNYKITE